MRLSPFVLRSLVAVALAGLLVAACGDDDDAGANVSPPGNETSADDGGGSPNTNGGNGDESGDALSEQDEVELGDVPEPGKAVLEVDGQTFEGDVGNCEFTDSDGDVTGFLVGATLEHNGQEISFGANGGRAPGSDWLVQSAVNIDGDVAYNSSNVNRAAVSGQSVVVEGEYVWLDDDGSMTAGDGRFAATCQ